MDLSDNKDFKKWIEALRSGEYSQTKHRLQDEIGYCCLGVACEVTVPDKKLVKYLSPKGQEIMDFSLPLNQGSAPLWLKHINENFYEKADKELTILNDYLDLTFDEIADCLEAVYTYKVLE